MQNRSLTVIFITILLDAMGIGLIFPLLPTLLQSVSPQADIAPLLGLLAALYALMQFFCAPLLGALADRFGRRPVLVLSLAGASINYLFLAGAGSLWMLFLGRAIAGLTAANMPVAAALISDLSAAAERPRLFGRLNAMFGIGFILGPVLGGLLGDHAPRLPFLAAALLTGGNLLLAMILLPSTPRPAAMKAPSTPLNPLAPLRQAPLAKGLLPLIAIFFIFSATGEAYGVCWALWGRDTFHWNGFWIGLSLGSFGLCQTVAQMFLPGPAVRHLGERATILLGSACFCLALLVMALARQGWLVFAIMPLFSLGGIGTPALQALASRQVDEARQGWLQGVLAAAISLAATLAPAGFSSLYLLVQRRWPGAVWLSVIFLHLLGALLVLRLRLPTPDQRQSAGTA